MHINRTLSLKRLGKDKGNFVNWMKISANYNFDETFVCRCLRVNTAVMKYNPKQLGEERIY